MKEERNWKRFLALFMAVAMVMASGVFVTTQSFQATDDESYEMDDAETTQSVGDDEDYSEEEVDVAEGESEDDLEEEDADEESEDADDEEIDGEDAENGEELETADVKSVKVKFNLNGGEGNETPEIVDAEADESGELDIDLPELEDYTDGNGATHIFEGWSSDAEATEAEENIAADGEALELYAVWSLEENNEEAAAGEQAAEQPEQAAAEEQTEAQAVEEQPDAQVETAEAVEENAEEQTDEEAVEETTEEETTEEAEATDENAEAEQQLTPEELEAQQLAELLATYVAGDAFGTSDDVSVSASWDEGVFPEGTTMSVEKISSEDALEMLGDAAEDATDAVAVDITFIGPDGNEVQPYNNAPVNISFSFGTPVFGEEQTLYHIDESGSVDAVGSADVSETGVDFEATGFSPFVLKIKNGDTHSYENREESLTFEAFQDITLAENWTQTVEGKEVTVGGKWEIDEAGKEILNFFDGEDTNPKGGTDPETEPVSVRLQTTGKSGDAVVTFKYTVGNNDYVDTFKIHIKGYIIHFNANGGQGKIPDQTVTMTAGGYAIVQLPGQGEMSKSGYNFKGWGLVSDLLSKNRWYGWNYFTAMNGLDQQFLYPGDDGNEATTDDTYRIEIGSGDDKAQEEYTFYAQWASQNGTSLSESRIGFFIRHGNEIQTEPANYSGNDYDNVFQEKYGVGEEIYYGGVIEVGNVANYIGEISNETNAEKANARITSTAKAKLDQYNQASYKKTGKWIWNPETEEPYWYVIKRRDGRWNVDGIIQPKSGTEETGGVARLMYDVNCTNYTGQAPPSRQYDIGSEITIPANNSFTLARAGYTLTGWNTQSDGKGSGYVAGDKFTLKKDTTLYAQWVPNGDTKYTLLGYDSETGEPIGTYVKVRKGVTGNTITANDDDKILSGYVFDVGNPKNVLQDHIKGDGSTTLKLYFKPSLKVTIVPVDTSKKYDGQEVTDRIDHLVVKVGSNEETVTDFTLNGSELTFSESLHDKDNTRSYTITGLSIGLTKDNKSANAATVVGTYIVTADVSSAAINKSGVVYEIAAESGKIEIMPRTVVLTSGSGPKEGWNYDGTTHKVEEVTVSEDSDGWLSTDEPEYYFIGAQKLPGTSDNVFVRKKDQVRGQTDWEKEFPNYSITVNYGTLKVNGKEDGVVLPITLSINPESSTYPYDGTEHSIDKDAFKISGSGATEVDTELSAFEKIGDFFTRNVTKRFKIGNETYTLTGITAIGGKGTDAGTYPITFEQGKKAKITDSDNNDVSDLFYVKSESDAVLTITKATLKLQSADLSKAYNGEPLVNGDTPLAVEEGWADGEGATYSFVSSITEPGQTPNEFMINSYNSDTKADNYDIENSVIEFGKLTIESNNGSLTIPQAQITPNGAGYLYDGEPKSVSGFAGQDADGRILVTASNGKEYYLSNISAGVEGKINAGTYPVSVNTEGYKVETKNGKDVTAEFATPTADTANLVINKRTVTFTSGSGSWQYDGDAHKVEEVVVGGDGLTDNDKEAINYTNFAEIKTKGSKSNTFEYEPALDTNNYDFGEYADTQGKVYGTLTVIDREAKYDIILTPNSGTYTYDGQEHTVSGFTGVETDDQGRIPVTVDGKEYYVIGVTVPTTTETDAGTYPIQVDISDEVVVVDKDGNPVTDQFNVVASDGASLTINKADVTLKSADLSKDYDGKPLVNGDTPLEVESGWATFDDDRENEGAIYTFTGSRTQPGESSNSFTYELKSNTKAENYNLPTTDEEMAECFGTLKVDPLTDGKKISIEIKGASATVTYNGQKQTVSEFEVNGAQTQADGEGRIPVTVNGLDYYVSGLECTASGKNVGNYTAEVTGTPAVTDAQGQGVTDQFKVNIVDGALTIEKRQITIKSASLHKPYDGTFLTNGGNSLVVDAKSPVELDEDGQGTISGVEGIAESGLAEGDSIEEVVSFSFPKTGARLPNQLVSNTYRYTLTDKKGANYEVAKEEYGTLTVLPLDEASRYAIRLIGKTDTVTYDGQSHSVSGFATYTYDGEEHDVTVDDQGRIPVEVAGNTYYISEIGTTEATGTHAGEYPNTLNGKVATVTDDEGNSVSEQFSVSATAGKLTINRKQITLTSDNGEWVYDGAVHKAEHATMSPADGLLPGEYLNITFTGSQQWVGESDNTFEVSMGEKKDGKVDAEGGGDDDANSADEEKTGFLHFGMTAYAAELDEAEAADTEETAKTVSASGGNVVIVGDYEIVCVCGRLKVTEPANGGKDDSTGTNMVVQKIHGEPQDPDGVFKIGETINFTITAKNIYAEPRTITFKEQEGVTLDQDTFENVEAGKTVTTTAHYTVTEEDAFAEGTSPRYRNTVKAMISGGGTYEATDDVTVEKAGAALVVDKTADIDGVAQIGDEISYNITVRNVGNVTVSDITVTDKLTGDSWEIDGLPAGGAREFSAKYTVTEADAEKGYVKNVAVAKGKDAQGNDVTSGNETTSDADDENNDDDNEDDNGNGTSIVKVNQMFNLTIHYVDENGNPIAADYTGSYKYGDSFSVKSPSVSGYTAAYAYINSDENGMPLKDVEVTVPYVKNAEVINNNNNNGGSSAGNSDDDDDDDDDSSSGSSKTSRTSRNSDGSNTTGSSSDTTGGVSTPEVTDDQVAESNNRLRRNGGTPIGDDGATVTLDENGEPTLVSASDTETPLFNLGLGDHKCNVLRLLILLAAFAVALVHTKKMRQYQSRLFELREKLEEEKK